MNPTERIKNIYDRNAKLYDLLERIIKAETRKRALKHARGNVLEVGVGTGKNIPYYPRGCRVTAVDISSEMLRKASYKAEGASLQVEFMQMDVENLEFPADNFDTVIATCVFCTVPDPLKGLHELKRVCKRDGRIVLLEHVRSENTVTGFLMDLLNPLTVRLIGDNINRETVKFVKDAGLNIKSVENVQGKLIKLIVAEP